MDRTIERKIKQQAGRRSKAKPRANPPRQPETLGKMLEAAADKFTTKMHSALAKDLRTRGFKAKIDPKHPWVINVVRPTGEAGLLRVQAHIDGTSSGQYEVTSGAREGKRFATQIKKPTALRETALEAAKAIIIRGEISRALGT